MKFKYTILYVEDVSATIEFFEAAFSCQKAMIHESGDYGELATGDTKLAFSSLKLMDQLGKSPATASPTGPTFELAFETEDVSKALQQAIDAGAKLVQDLEEMPWGQTTAYVCEPNGFLIEICTPIVG
ncbi:MAG: VOC family protein [Cyanobacteria bacterium P01_A01_bin.17]